MEVVQVEAGPVKLEGILEVPEGARGIVMFVHGSGSSRSSRRNQAVAERIRGRNLGTLLFDLLTVEENSVDQLMAELRFDIPLLAERVVGTVEWVRSEYPDLSVGLIGSSTGAAAALVAASECPVQAVVSRGGRPDLAHAIFSAVRAPTMLIVGSEDTGVLELNQESFVALTCEKRLVVIPGATHLFEEPGTLEAASDFARQWFIDHL